MYYDKSEKLGKNLTKFSTFCVFVVVCALLTICTYDLIIQNYNKIYTSLPRTPYISVWVITGVIIAYYLYKEDFQDFNEYNDYNKKYYLYFFTIIIVVLCLVIYTGKISRERIFKQREIQKEQIENRKNNLRIN